VPAPPAPPAGPPPLRISYPPELPVSAHREQLLAAIRDHQVVVVAGETGSGKTTQLPKLCLELGRQSIAHTQPRRIAARSVAERIAHELQTPLGGAVGYAVRFSDRSRVDTRVRLMTDGLLLAEIQHDRQLRRYDTIVVDEAHERSLNVDFLLGCVKRILPRRPELKLIVTSATIDPQRFSAHFGGAPVIEVSGRTYPVEQRYRPFEPAERDQADAIGDAVEELLALGPHGDILVFLSGEREIRDTADALRGRLRRAGARAQDVELLPLYARLSSAEQQRVFAPHRGRRIVLATNVAETSLTVPGIRYVIDPGTARISRYSARLKVQRLPIEPISQASAAQRAGRCGRTADGICIRLYSEADHDARPRFTDPEILRTSLASVILQMAALGLGAVEDFPFMDPPDARQVRDGILLLQELGALSAERRLTGLGRRLARLPVDPRLGRMVLEGGRLGCAEETIVIAAALSIQDPRERPAEQREEAGALHARFDDPDSDFLAFLRLWDHLREGRRELSGNQFRKRCREEYLHPLRVREWQDLAAQLRGAARGAARVELNRAPSEPELIHRALLSGLLSHVGMKEARGDGARDRGRRGPVEYAGARGARFALSRDSALARRTPPWAMVAELVETNRLWGHTAARIDPRWIEPLAGHLVRRSHGDPRWDARRGAAVVSERVTLYGLPIVDGRAVGLARIDPALARLLFVRHALVGGEWDGRYAFVEENARRVAEATELEERARRRGLVAGEDARAAFFDARLPAGVASAADFERWWRGAGAAEREALVYPRELLVPPEAVAAVSPVDWPQAWRQDDVELALDYRFEPGAAHDGVTVRVPLALLGRVRENGFEWLVPGLRFELVTTLIRSLPKELRRTLVPAPEVAAAALERIAPQAPEAAAARATAAARAHTMPQAPAAAPATRTPAAGERSASAAPTPPLLDALAAALEALRGVRIPREAWDLTRLGPHLRVRFRVEDERGAALAEGEQLEALRAAVRPRLRAQLSAAAPELRRSGLRAWSIGALSREVALPGTAGAARAYPALVDEGETAGVQLFDSPAAQAVAMRAGTRRLLLCTMPQTVRYVRDHVDAATRLALAAAPGGAAGEPPRGSAAAREATPSRERADAGAGERRDASAAARAAAAPRDRSGAVAIVDDALEAATDALVAEASGPAWDEVAFAALRAHVAGALAERAARTLAHTVGVLAAARAVRQRLDALANAPAPFHPAREDVQQQLRRLAGPGFVSRAGAERLPDVERYLRAAERRLERLPDQLGADRDRMAAIHELEAAVEQRVASLPPGVPPPDALHEARWLVEELRVSAFAQALGVRGRASEKRVRQMLRAVDAA
jgi:ATP-dependent helicase HrpA